MDGFKKYMNDLFKWGKEPGKLTNNDISFMASQSKDPGRTYAEYKYFEDRNKKIFGGSDNNDSGGWDD